MRMVCEDMGHRVQGPSAVMIDNQACRDVIIHPGTSSRTRYYERATLLVKRLWEILVVAPYLIGSLPP